MNRELLQKYIEGNISDEDALEVVDWLDRDESHVREYLALHKLHDITIVNQTGAATVNTLVGRRMRLRRIWRKIAGIAAVVAAVLAIERIVMAVNSPAEEPAAVQTVYVPAGQRARVDLPDGTRVWVNAKSTLTYPVDFGRNVREVTLDGEALFYVEADAEHPFLVNTASLNVKAIGTEFCVSSYSGSGVLSVALLKGTVSLLSPSGSLPLYTMNPNDYVEWSDNRLQVSTVKNHDYFRWSEGLICFNNETVGEIIKKLEFYYDIAIEVDRKDLLEYRYTGKFRAKDGVEQVLKTIQMEHHFRFRKDTENNRIIIK